MSVLSVQDLAVTYKAEPAVHALNGVTLDLSGGEALGVLGESGSGKSTLARTILGLTNTADISGRISLGSERLDGLDEDEWRRHRWGRISLVFQSTSALNPVLTIGKQVAEPLIVGEAMARAEAHERARAMMERVGLDGDTFDRNPGELSGGRRRLALLAVALIRDPEIVLLDEPTAGLDPITRVKVLDLLSNMRSDGQRRIMLFTHDIEALRAISDRIAVLYRGQVTELGPSARVLDRPRHPYTWGLLNAHPSLGTLKDLRGIRGDPPDPTVKVSGCPFAERCTQVIDDCLDRPPPMIEQDADHHVACVRGGIVSVVRARGLRKVYRQGVLKRRSKVTAVDTVDLDVHEGEVVGLVGPNGAGKSTIGKMLVRLIDSDDGSVEFEGDDLMTMDKARLKRARRHLQMLFQDPYEALSPRMTVRDCVREPLDIQDIGDPSSRDEAVRRVLGEVRLPGAAILDRYTHELSGGQIARVGLARALVLEPKLIVADEPFEGLDPSEQAKMLQLLKAIQVDRGMAVLLVSHDLALVLRTCDRILVLDEGRIVEAGTGAELLLAPAAPITRRLLRAAGAITPPSAYGSGHITNLTNTGDEQPVRGGSRE